MVECVRVRWSVQGCVGVFESELGCVRMRWVCDGVLEYVVCCGSVRMCMRLSGSQ